MSKLTLDDAIKHCLEVAEQKERDSAELIAILDELNVDACKECAADHRQLAEWLMKLKELEAKHWDECRQIAHYDDEIKRLEAPVKHGRWENEYLEDDDVWWADCTNCNNDTHSRFGRVSIYAYCPNCGADMRGDTE